MAKEEKVYDEFGINISFTDNDRAELRIKVVNCFLREKCGYWKGGVKHVTKYKYYVEKLVDGRRIFLDRPTYLNKGIDFQVWVEKFDDGEDGRPSHDDILTDLKKKRDAKPENYQKLIQAIERVSNCEEPDMIMRDYNGVDFGAGFSLELILKVLKWLFIEQDITYWNYDGRGKLFQVIKQI